MKIQGFLGNFFNGFRVVEELYICDVAEHEYDEDGDNVYDKEDDDFQLQW